MSPRPHYKSDMPYPESYSYLFFFFNDTATTEIYTLSLHDALPIFRRDRPGAPAAAPAGALQLRPALEGRSEEHTSELQSPYDLVCRLLLEKKKGMVLWGFAVDVLDIVAFEVAFVFYNSYLPRIART